jgi:flagellar protein FlgJ
VSTDLQQRLAEVAGIAVRLESTTGVPARLLIAQWAIESRWGNAPAGEHNYFGIKRTSRHTDFCVVTTHEYLTQKQIDAWNRKHSSRPARVIGEQPSGKILVELEDEFADYPSLESACEDYAWLISQGDPYQKAWRNYQASGDLSALIDSIARGYATDPQYAGLVKQIAGQSNVATAIQSAQREAA